MRYTPRTTGQLAGGLLLLLPLCALAAEIQITGPDQAHIRPVVTTDSAGRLVVEPSLSTKADHAAGFTSSAYNPPRRGTSARTLRVGGGTRGQGVVQPTISVLAPNDMGITVHNQPTLYWYSSGSLATTVLFTLIESDAVVPTVVARLEVPMKAGIHPVRLADFGIRLEAGKTYEWSVAIVANHVRRSHDVVAMGEIEFVPVSDQPMNSYLDYAQRGLWYDAMMALSELLAARPTDVLLRLHRAALADAVGLNVVASYDRNVDTYE